MWNPVDPPRFLGFLDDSAPTRSSSAFALTDAGQIVGVSTDAQHHQQSVAAGIDDLGRIAGWAIDAGEIYRAFLRGGDGVLRPLDEIVGDGWVLERATISGGGTIIAQGSNPGQSIGYGWHVFIETPTSVVPEPSAVVLLATGLVGLGLARRRRKSAASAEES